VNDAYPAPGTLLDRAAEALRDAVERELLTPGDRAWITSTATRLEALAGAIRAKPEPTADPAPAPLAKPERALSRKEAAAVVGVHPNTLLNLERRGLLKPRRDANGWRCYSRADLARAMAIAARLEITAEPGS